ncbi:metalloregulator ArsR/SmtB family transcription factor [Henriciella sp. AS95]
MNRVSKEMRPLADEAASLLKALSHPARLMICCQLRGQELSVGEIEEVLDIHQPRLSRELAKLREEGLVETRREAKSIFYRLAEESRVGPMIDAICMVMMGKVAPDVKPLARIARTAFVKTTVSEGAGQFARIIR